ncbi:hypothetical protein A2U01_0099681, partial [Trifolium medium]|nr:hypothetical protein [Trifolium medium]
FVSTARRADVAGTLRASAEDGWEMLCQLRVAHEWIARRAGQQEGSIRSLCHLRVAQ